VIPEWYRGRIQKKFSITVEEWEKREGVKLEDGLYRDLTRRGAGDELAAGYAKSQMMHEVSQALIQKKSSSNPFKLFIILIKT